MWTTYKTKDGQTVEAIAKANKLNDPKIILLHPKNKAAVVAFKKKAPLPKNTQVWVPDPKVKCYVYKIGSKQEVMTEAEWKVAIKKLNKAMDTAADRIKRDYDSVKWRHDAQTDINNEFKWVYRFSKTWFGDKGREPVAQAKRADTAVKKLIGITKSRNYKGFQAAVIDAEKSINDYIRGLEEWIAKLTGDAATATTLLTYTRDASFVVFGAAAMTVAAPVGVAATIGAGAAVGAGTSSMSGLAEEAGRAWASNASKGDPYDGKGASARLMKKIGIGALTGMAGAGISRYIGKFIAPKIAARLLTSQRLTNLSVRLVSKSRFQGMLGSMLEKELAAAGKHLASGTILMTVDEANKIFVAIISRFLVRLGPASVIKIASNAPDIIRWVENWIQSNAGSIDALAGEDKVGDVIAKAFDKDPALESLFHALVEDNIKQIKAEVCIEIRNEIKARMKKAK